MAAEDISAECAGSGAVQDRMRLRRVCGRAVLAGRRGQRAGGAEPGLQRDPDYIAHMVLDQRISVLHFVPSLLELFLGDRPAYERYPGLRMVLAGGEALSAPLVAQFADQCERPAVQHVRTSKCPVYTTALRYPAGPVERVLIGSAVDGVQLYVLDATGAPTVEKPGELYVAGDGLAREYFRRPDMTAERFVVLDRESLPPVRAYRTGDLVRRVGSQLDFLGRIDRQVKIRGYRVELAEVEATVRRLTGIDSVVVLPVTLGRTQVLAAFVVPAAPGGADVSADAVRAAVRRELPDYMVPASVTTLGRLPLTPNGKVDQDELVRVLDESRPSDSVADESGATPDEHVRAVWTVALGIEPDDEDDFFDLGGNSLIALDVVGEIGARLGVDVPVRELFVHPGLAEFAARVEAIQAGRSGTAQ